MMRRPGAIRWRGLRRLRGRAARGALDGGRHHVMLRAEHSSSTGQHHSMHVQISLQLCARLLKQRMGSSSAGKRTSSFEATRRHTLTA